MKSKSDSSGPLITQIHKWKKDQAIIPDWGKREKMARTVVANYLNLETIRTASVEWASMPENIVNFAATLGLGPKYKPQSVMTTYECPNCKGHQAYYKEEGSDCDAEQNEMVLYCPECRKTND